jgi:predicted Zn-dependent protease
LAAQEAQRKLTAKPVAPGKYDLALDATTLATIHESIGLTCSTARWLGQFAERPS